MKKRTCGIIMQVPVWILLVVLFISFIYLSITGFNGMPGSQFFGYGIPIWIIIILYFWGRYIQGSKDYPGF